MAKEREWKNGDRAIYYQTGHDQQDRFEGSVHDLIPDVLRHSDGRPKRWWFIPKGCRVVEGIPLDEKELREL